MKRSEKYDAVIGGYYGFGNMGDDTVLCRITQKLKEKNPNVRIAVIAEHKELSEKRYGVSCIGRFDISGIIRAMRGAGVFVLGGGSLFQNETSSRSLLYYTFMVRLAGLLCKSVYIYANGVGALRGDFAYRITRKALRCADRISVRDPDSFNLVSKMCGGEGRAVLSADPVFLKEPVKKSEAQKLPGGDILRGKRYFALSLRETLRQEELPLGEIVDFCKAYERRGLLPVFVPMQESHDGALCRRAAAECGGIVINCADSTELLSLLSCAEFAVGMRLHFLLMSLMSLCPTVALSYDCKIDSSVPYAGGGHILPVGGVTAEGLVCETERAKKDTDAQKLRKRCLEMRSLAMWDANVLCNAACKSLYADKTTEAVRKPAEGAVDDGRRAAHITITPW